MTTDQAARAADQRTFWREQGGEAWAGNIETVESQIAGLSGILLDRAGPRSGESVLDVGCGGGVTSKAAADAVGPEGQVLGVDVSDVVLDVARRRYAEVPNLRFETGDAESMALPEAGFDLILSRFGVMFFEDPVRAFVNLRDALRQDGRLVFICWREPQANPWMGVPVAAVFDVIEPAPPPDPDAPGPFAFADADRVRSILGEAGFDNVGLEQIDAEVDLGSVDRAVKLISELGPAAASLAEVSEGERGRALDAVRRALAVYETPQGLRLPSSTWIVTATRAGGDV